MTVKYGVNCCTCVVAEFPSGSQPPWNKSHSCCHHHLTQNKSLTFPSLSFLIFLKWQNRDENECKDANFMGPEIKKLENYWFNWQKLFPPNKSHKSENNLLFSHAAHIALLVLYFLINFKVSSLLTSNTDGLAPKLKKNYNKAQKPHRVKEIRNVFIWDFKIKHLKAIHGLLASFRRHGLVVIKEVT